MKQSLKKLFPKEKKMDSLKINEEINGTTIVSELRRILPGEEYYVSEYSNFYSNRTGKMRKLTIMKDETISLNGVKTSVTKKWFKFALKTFKPNEMELKYLIYIDGNSKNRHFTNLRWSKTKVNFFRNAEKSIIIDDVVIINNVEDVRQVEIRNFGYDGYYISEYGKPYSCKRENKLTRIKINKRKSGFDFFYINVDGKTIDIDTNTATAKAFIPTTNELPFVLFKDENKSNKHYTNLYWNSTCESTDDSFQSLPGFSSYKVDRLGRCKSYLTKYPVFMRPHRDENGYYSYSLKNDEGKSQMIKRHRAVAITFIPNPENKPEVDHIDRKPGNDKVENLQWVTKIENAANKDYEEIARKQYKRIGCFDQENNLIEEYKNVYEAAGSIIEDDEKVNVPHLLRLCAKKNGSLTESEKYRSIYGFVWKYTTEKEKYEILPDEKLIPIKNEDFDTKYFITTELNIIGSKGYRLKILQRGGYPAVAMWLNGVAKIIGMHRLVAMFFVPGRSEENNIVNHLDENKMNYNPKNLEWTTTPKNVLHSAHQRWIPLDQFDVEGKYIKSFPNSKMAAASIPNALPNCILKKCKEGTAYGYIWRHSDPSIPIPNDLDVKDSSITKAVDQFDLNGKFIERFNSITDAAAQTNNFHSGISQCCRMARNKCGEYLWRYADTDKNKNPTDLKLEETDEGQYGSNKVLQLTRNGVFLRKHEDVFAAAEFAGVTPKKIYECCTGKFKSVAKSAWKFEQ